MVTKSLEPASLRARAVAKLVDVLLVLAVVGSVAGIAAALARLNEHALFAQLSAIAGVVLTVLGLVLYSAVAEAKTGTTVGKRLIGLKVVHESGRPIDFGEALVRHLPWLLQVFWIDALFAVFTDRRQRAFERLSKTCVVRR